MLVSVNWIKDFVDLPSELSPEEIGQKYTLGTAEVEEVQSIGDLFEKVIVVQVKKIDKHPNADKLGLVTFDMGGGKEKEVVCGDLSLEVGLKIPYAPLKTKFPNGLILEAKKIRGIFSEGMLCSAVELGIGEDAKGILRLSNDAVLGESLLTTLRKQKDVVLDIDNKSLTHRPDLWGHFGQAREFSAIFNKPLRNPYDVTWERKLEEKFTGEASPIIPSIEGDSSCVGYFGLSVDNVSVGVSPDWMCDRLLAVGLRPINNIVDISNYVMLELGIPLHIFDRDLIAQSKLKIHRLDKECEFVTLDGIGRKLNEKDTVISDANGPLVLGGIMGGEKCGVNDQTSRVFIEVANWIPEQVRRTSTRLGLRTESSQRYEKGLDSNLLKKTLLRTLDLILQFCPEAKVVGKLEYVGEKFWEVKPLKIKTSYSKISKKLGKEISPSEINRIFKSLDFSLSREDECDLVVTVPSYRATKDIEGEADLVEEIGRIIGYDNIPAQAPLAPLLPIRPGPIVKLHRKIQDFLVLHGKAFEVTTYPLIGEKLLKACDYQDQNLDLKLDNFLSLEQDRMRSSLIPSLLDVLAKNQKNYDSFRFFELGRSYHKDEKDFAIEKGQLGIVFYHKQRKTIIELVNTIERLLNYLGLKAEFQAVNDTQGNKKFKNDCIPLDWSGRHPEEYLHIKIRGKYQGAITTIHPLILKNYKIKGKASLAIIDLSSFEKMEIRNKVSFNSPSKFPVSTFDCTVSVPAKTKVESVLSAVKKCRFKEILSSSIADIYSSEEGKKFVTLRNVIGSKEKTLPGEDLTKIQNGILEGLDKAGFPLKM